MTSTIVQRQTVSLILLSMALAMIHLAGVRLMTKFLAIMLSLMLVASNSFARMGSSYSRSSGSSHSYSSSHSSPSYSSRPSYTPSYRPAPTYRPSAPVQQHVTVNRTTNVTHNHDSSSGGSSGGGMGIGSTIMGVAGGVVVGNALTNMLSGDHRNAGYAPAGGYQAQPNGVPVAGQPVAPAVAGATEGSYVTDGQGGYIPAPIASVNHENSFDLWKFFLYIITAIILAVVLKMLWDWYSAMRERKNELNEMLQEELNMDKFRQIFTTVQAAYSAGSTISLSTYMTKDMYTRIRLLRSENEEKGLTNIVENVEVRDINTIRSWSNDGNKYHQVKIRFSMIDYVQDETGKITEGSKDKRQTAVELWTFKSSDNKNWFIDRIDQYSGYVHQD